MTSPVLRHRQTRIALIVLFAGLLGIGIHLGRSTTAQSALLPKRSESTNDFSSTETINQTVYLPIIANNYPWISPFGIESNQALVEGSTYLTRAVDLDVGWVRMGSNRISWRSLQEFEGDEINWDLLITFEDELRALNSAGITPVVIVQDSPHWATTVPTSCGPIREDKFPAFAIFMLQLVNRYKTPEFNVHNWEIGNEPDVDPHIISPDSGFGCWGDMNDPFYGGRHYGEMLKYITPVIKQEDPSAKVWIGGLLLDKPESEPGFNKPGMFLAGILEAGAAPYFDVVPYHSYIGYWDGFTGDYEKDLNPSWQEKGGIIVGKARYLRDIMSSYGVQKPLFANETSLFCYYADSDPSCKIGLEGEAIEPYYEAQADFVVRSMVRGLSENLMGFTWYTLNGPGWRNGGLLNTNQSHRPVYIAYQQLTLQLENTRYIESVDYRPDIEAYAFNRGSEHVHILWTVTDQDPPVTVQIPQDKFSEAYKRDGEPINPHLNGSYYQIPVGFSPIYVLRDP